MIKIRAFTAVAFVAAALAILNACVGSDAPAQPISRTLAAAETLPEAKTLSGSYLAGRFAQRQQDWNAAQSYVNTVISFDTGNNALEQRAFLLSLGAGEYDRAKKLAENISKSPKGDSDLALIYLACDALSNNEFEKAITFAARLPKDGFGQFTKPLLTAWAKVGLGQKEEALALLRDHTASDDPTYNFHAGLIEEMLGNTAAASRYFETAIKNGPTLNAAVMAARFFQKNDRQDLTEKIYKSLAKSYPMSPFITELRNHTTEGTSVKTPAEGAGIALFDLASLLYERRSYDSAQVYGRLVQRLVPSSDFVSMMMGDIAAVGNQYQASVASYERISENSPLYWLARLRVAEVYEAMEDQPRAVELLQSLSLNEKTRLPALAALGDIHRRQGRYAAAVESYNAAIEVVDKSKPEYWTIFYARGMALERINEWDRAEKDLMAALAFQPDNPMILNFIGYTWAEKGLNLDRALEFTRRAAELKPEDGYILDSHGWALYRMGKYTEAVQWMERAVAQTPDEAAILDHLGDAYWQVGRKNEARFKWKHAMENSKDAEFRAAVTHKIKNGVEAKPTVAVHQDTKI